MSLSILKLYTDKGMNIVLVTWIGGGNFGTSLQSYALHKKLFDLGHNVGIITVFPNQNKFISIIKQFFSLLGLLKLRSLVEYAFASRGKRKLIQFQKKNYNRFELLTNNSLKRLVNQTDCFISGSDQIWNTHFNFSPNYFLSFAENHKRIAYASSIGTSGIKEEYLNQVKNYLLDFSHIGVREFDTVKVLSSLTGRNDIRQVLDPTLLLTQNEWKKLSKDAVYEETLPKKYILCYLIGKNEIYAKQLKEVKERYRMDTIIIPATENPNITYENDIVYRNASPAEFVDLLLNANLVCTDSFHATALCINFSVPFVEFMRFSNNSLASQNTRIYDILNHYSLMDRIYECDSSEWSKPIDFTSIQEQLRRDRKDSLNYLINAINN